MSENDINLLLSEIKDSKWIITVGLIGLILFIVFITKGLKKSRAKNNERIKKEVADYLQIGNEQPYRYSGNVSVNSNSVTYSRGNKSCIFDILIEKETILAPCLIDDWFINRNYSTREADKILQDIKEYLLNYKICKTVAILTDEEYIELVDREDAENNSGFDK